MAAKSKNPAAKEKPAKKSNVERDAFGCRAGSQAAQINAALSKKPKSAEKVVEETGLDAARVRAHLKFLVSKHLAKETAEGFAATPKPTA